MKRTVYYAVALLSAIALAGCGGTGQRKVNPVPEEPSGQYIAKKQQLARIKMEVESRPGDAVYWGAGCIADGCNHLAQATPQKAVIEEPERSQQCALPAPKPVPEAKPEPPADREAGPAPTGDAGGNVGMVKEAAVGSEGGYKYPEAKEGAGRTLKVYKRE